MTRPRSATIDDMSMLNLELLIVGGDIRVRDAFYAAFHPTHRTCSDASCTANRHIFFSRDPLHADPTIYVRHRDSDFDHRMPSRDFLGPSSPLNENPPWYENWTLQCVRPALLTVTDAERITAGSKMLLCSLAHAKRNICVMVLLDVESTLRTAGAIGRHPVLSAEEQVEAYRIATAYVKAQIYGYLNGIRGLERRDPVLVFVAICNAYRAQEHCVVTSEFQVLNQLVRDVHQLCIQTDTFFVQIPTLEECHVRSACELVAARYALSI